MKIAAMRCLKSENFYLQFLLKKKKKEININVF